MELDNQGNVVSPSSADAAQLKFSPRATGAKRPREGEEEVFEERHAGPVSTPDPVTTSRSSALPLWTIVGTVRGSSKAAYIKTQRSVSPAFRDKAAATVSAADAFVNEEQQVLSEAQRYKSKTMLGVSV